MERQKIDLLIDELEERIAPAGLCGCDGSQSASHGSKSASHGSKGHSKGNNGYGNGGDDGVPGRSADNDSPNADEKAADVVR